MHFPLANPLRQLPALLLLSSTFFSALALPTTQDSAKLLSRAPAHDPYPNAAAVNAAYIASSAPTVFFSNTGSRSDAERAWPDTFANKQEIGGRTFRMAFPNGYCDRADGAGSRQFYGAFAVRFSTVLAERAEGTAYVLLRGDPDGPHPNSVWERFERPALQRAGGAVNKIVKVDPSTFEESDLWVRGGAKRSEEVEERDVPDQRDYVLDWDAPADGPYWLAPGE